MKALIKSINEEYADLQKRSVMYTRKTGGPKRWKYEYDTPHEKKMTHEFHRITTMDEDALKRRAGKITDQEKMSRFFGIARASGKGGLAEHIRQQGIGRLHMSPEMFKAGVKGMKWGQHTEGEPSDKQRLKFGKPQRVMDSTTKEWRDETHQEIKARIKRAADFYRHST